MADAVLDAAVAHHRAGRFEDAERGYEAVLAGEPGNVRALHNLGVLLRRRGEADRALPMLAAAFEMAPPDFPAWVAYVEGLIAVERFEAAADVLKRRGAGAKALALEVRLHQAWGMALMRERDDAAAEPHFRQVCELAPDLPDAPTDLGLVQLRLGRAAEAEANFRRTLALAPEHVGALVNLGTALKAQRRLEDAEGAYRQALAKEPSQAAAIRNLNLLLFDQGRFDEALHGAEHGLKIGGSTGELLLARGQALGGLGRFEEALACYQAAAKDPDLRYEALTRLGVMQATMRRHDEALATMNRAIALKPQEPLAYYRRAFMRLLRCDFAAGWSDYERRLEVDEFFVQGGGFTPELRASVERRAAPERLAGQRVLLIGEQGIGDQVMFASIIPDLARTAGPITFACEARLVRLFSNSFPGMSLLPAPGSTVQRVDYDRFLALGSLGHMYRRRIEDFPKKPYLSPRTEVRERWAARLGPRPAGLRIGLSWRGGLHRTGTARRSLTLDQFAPLLSLPGCEFVSLQYGEVEVEVAAFNQTQANKIRIFPKAEIDDFEDLAALVLGLDVVVSVQTSLVHLCGAIGQDCLTLLPHNPEWRYTLNASSMPWYESVRLYRQAAVGAWDPVIEEVTDALKNRLGA